MNPPCERKSRFEHNQSTYINLIEQLKWKKTQKPLLEVYFQYYKTACSRNKTKIHGLILSESTDVTILFFIFQAAKQNKHDWRLPSVNSFLFLILLASAAKLATK